MSATAERLFFADGSLDPQGVQRIVDGPVNASVTLELGSGRTATAVVTRESVESLGLALGKRACAAFKASSVILAVID